VLFLTAQATDVDFIYQAYQVGAVDYLVKPLNPDVVRAKVAVFAQLYRQRKRIEHQAALLLDAERREGDLRIAELRLATERRYQALSEAVPQIVWSAGPDGVVDYFNQRWFELTGFSAEATAASWESAIHAADLDRFRARWRDAVRRGEMFQTEVRLGRAGEAIWRWQLCRAVPERSATGQILYWLGTFTDIEDQRRAHAALSEFKATLDAVLDAVLMFDPEEERFIYINHGATVLLGYTREELTVMRVADLMPDYDLVAFRELLGPLRDGTKSVIMIDTEVRRKDGRTVPIEVSLQLIRIDGGRLVAIARDITDRKRAQLERELLYREAVDALRARDEFLSVASHELKTPLSALQIQIERLGRVDPAEPEKARSKVAMAAKQVVRLSRLVGNLFDVSRITAGKLRIERERVDLAESVRDVVARFREQAAAARCRVEVSGEDSVVGEWDRVRIEQVITNLFTNAMKFGAGRPIDLRVEDGGPSARLVIRDRGVGITPEDAERIFERYEQATSARALGGLGLGLYIARQIVEAHGGTIRVESQPGAGSTFTVDLPKRPAEALTAAAGPPGEAPS
jgi:PAS domain S-box-containing protein